MLYVGAYFGGLIMMLLLCIVGAMADPAGIKQVFPALVLLAVTWPISFPVILALANKAINK